jgi:hypothetical protein
MSASGFIVPFVVVFLACLGIAYAVVRSRTSLPRFGDVVLETVRYLVALAILGACLLSPLLFIDLDSKSGQLAMITAAIWGPAVLVVCAVVGGTLALAFLLLTRFRPRRTVGDIAREKALQEEQRLRRP